MLCFTLRFIFTFIVIFYYFLFCFVIFDGSKIVGIRFSRVLAAIIFQVYIYIHMTPLQNVVFFSNFRGLIYHLVIDDSLLWEISPFFETTSIERSMGHL